LSPGLSPAGGTDNKNNPLYNNKYGGFLFYGGEAVSKIVHVMPREDYCLEIVLDNGSSVNLSLKNRLDTIRFGLLADAELFKKATTNGVCISWEGKVEISLNEAFQLAQK
jgi:hypothetical protein